VVILTIRSNSGSLVSAKAYRKVQTIRASLRNKTELACYLLDDDGQLPIVVDVQDDWTYVVEAPTKENIKLWVKSETAVSISHDVEGECQTGPLKDGYCSRGTIGCKAEHDKHTTYIGDTPQGALGVRPLGR
jgi:hypothetical protein